MSLRLDVNVEETDRVEDQWMARICECGGLSPEQMLVVGLIYELCPVCC